MSPRDNLQQVVLKEDLDDQAPHQDQERLARLEIVILTEDSLKAKLDLVAVHHSILRDHPDPSEDQELVRELEDPGQVEAMDYQDLVVEQESQELVAALGNLDLAQDLEAQETELELESLEQVKDLEHPALVDDQEHLEGLVYPDDREQVGP